MSTAAGAPAPEESVLDALRVNVIVGRARTGLSQSELAERANVSRQTVSRIERAATDVGIEAVERIARALGTTVGALVAPVGTHIVDDDELARRAVEPRDDYIEARAVLRAIDEAAGLVDGRDLKRFSRAGRPTLSR